MSSDIKHGRRATYVHAGCRCDDCRRAYSEYKKAGRAAGAPWVERDRASSAEAKRRRRAQGEKV